MSARKTPAEIMQNPPESFKRPGDPPGYEVQHRIMAGLDAAQERWVRETGARLEALPGPPYFRYSREHLPRPERTGETVRERPIRGAGGRVVGRVLVREYPDGSTRETHYDLEGRGLTLDGEVKGAA